MPFRLSVIRTSNHDWIPGMRRPRAGTHGASMKVTHQLSRIEPMVFHPLHGVNGDSWHRAPRKKWSVAQILQHIAIGVDLVATAFEQRADGPGMKRRSKPYQTVLRHLVLSVGHIPGGFKAPELTRPDDQPDPELAAAQFRMAVEKMKAFAEDWTAERQEARYVRHPLLGDLNFPEWVRFLYLHTRHHARQIHDRLEWDRQRG